MFYQRNVAKTRGKFISEFISDLFTESYKTFMDRHDQSHKDRQTPDKDYAVDFVPGRKSAVTPRNSCEPPHLSDIGYFITRIPRIPYVQFRSNRVIGRGFLSPAGISWGYSESTRRPIVYQEESPLYRHEIPASIVVPKMAASVIPRFQIPRLMMSSDTRTSDSRM